MQFQEQTKKNQKLIVCVAEDEVKIDNTKIPNSCTNILKNILKLSDEKTEDLPDFLPLIPNMPLMLTDNICTQLGLTNGTNAIFRSLIYEKEEENSPANDLNADLIFP